MANVRLNEETNKKIKTIKLNENFKSAEEVIQTAIDFYLENAITNEKLEEMNKILGKPVVYDFEGNAYEQETWTPEEILRREG